MCGELKSQKTFFVCVFMLKEETTLSVSFFLRAMIIALVCHNSVHFTLLSWLPTFFSETYPHAEVIKSLGHFFMGHCVLS